MAISDETVKIEMPAAPETQSSNDPILDALMALNPPQQRLADDIVLKYSKAIVDAEKRGVPVAQIAETLRQIDPRVNLPTLKRRIAAEIKSTKESVIVAGAP